MTSKETILSKIKTALQHTKPLTENNQDTETHIFEPLKKPLAEQFAAELQTVNGNVFLADTIDELWDSVRVYIRSKTIEKLFCLDPEIQAQLNQYSIAYTSNYEQFTEMDAAITRAEYFVARTGSVLVSAAHASGRRLNVFAPIHIVVGSEADLVAEIGDALQLLKNKYIKGLPSVVEFITGPSRTADIEKTLVLGAHGPKELVVFLVRNKKM